MDTADSAAGQDLGETGLATPIAAPLPVTTPTGLLTACLRRRPPRGPLALAIYLAVFIAGFGLPLVSHLNVPNLRQYWTDPQFYTWSMRWWPYAVSHGHQPAVLQPDRGAARLRPGLGEHHARRWTC